MIKSRLKWLRVDFILGRECIMKENGVISLNEHADSPEKVTTVKRVARVLLLLLLLLETFYSASWQEAQMR